MAPLVPCPDNGRHCGCENHQRGSRRYHECLRRSQATAQAAAAENRRLATVEAQREAAIAAERAEAARALHRRKSQELIGSAHRELRTQTSEHLIGPLLLASAHEASERICARALGFQERWEDLPEPSFFHGKRKMKKDLDATVEAAMNDALQVLEAALVSTGTMLTPETRQLARREVRKAIKQSGPLERAWAIVKTLLRTIVIPLLVNAASTHIVDPTVGHHDHSADTTASSQARSIERPSSTHEAPRGPGPAAPPTVPDQAEDPPGSP